MNERPVHEIRFGVVKAAIWRNETESGPRYNVTFSRIYKTQDNRWESTSSFGRDDLHLVAKLADQAESWIYQQLATSREEATTSAEASSSDPGSTANPGPNRGARRSQRATASTR